MIYKDYYAQFDTIDLPAIRAEWKLSRNDRPGECACGIVRSTCDYHR